MWYLWIIIPVLKILLFVLYVAIKIIDHWLYSLNNYLCDIRNNCFVNIVIEYGI